MKEARKGLHKIYLIFGAFMLFFLKINAETFVDMNPGLAAMGIVVSTYLLYNLVKHGKNIKALIEYGKTKVAFCRAQMDFEASLARCFVGKKQTSFQDTQNHVACWQKMKTLEKESNELKLHLQSLLRGKYTRKHNGYIFN